MSSVEMKCHDFFAESQSYEIRRWIDDPQW